MPEPTPLTVRHDIPLHPRAPFSFEGTVYKPSHFPSSDNDYQDRQLWQTTNLGGRVVGVKLADVGTLDGPEVLLSVFGEEELPKDYLDRIATEIEYRLDMKSDLSEFYDSCGQDAVLAPALSRWRGMRPSGMYSLYEYLIITTVLQNCTVRRSVQMLENLFRRYGSSVSYDSKTLSVFWEPEAIHLATEEELRGLKIGYRAKTLRRQAEPFALGQIDEFALRAAPRDQQRAQLLQLYGVGPASVLYLQFELFKRYDAFEHISPWEQKIYSRLLFDAELVDVKTIQDEVTARWGQWRMLAAHYVFEDLFWRRKNEYIPWLDELIRL